jgi:hypothetical protein
MGNINFKDIVCDNYYCQPISFKPEWFSENSWNINYVYYDIANTKNKISEKKNEDSTDSLNYTNNIENENFEHENIEKKDNETIENTLSSDSTFKKNVTEIFKNKPYIIDKGILKIKNVQKFDLLLSKKLLIDFEEIDKISIPINFKYDIETRIDFYIIFSNYIVNLDNINNLNLSNDNAFYINLTFLKKKIFISHSFNDKIIKKSINPNKINTFHLNLINNFNLLLIEEKLYNNNINKIFSEKYFKMFNCDHSNNIYLNLFIKPKTNICLENEFLELNFE